MMHTYSHVPTSDYRHPAGASASFHSAY